MVDLGSSQTAAGTSSMCQPQMCVRWCRCACCGRSPSGTGRSARSFLWTRCPPPPPSLLPFQFTPLPHAPGSAALAARNLPRGIQSENSAEPPYILGIYWCRHDALPEFGLRGVSSARPLHMDLCQSHSSFPKMQRRLRPQGYSSLALSRSHSNMFQSVSNYYSRSDLVLDDCCSEKTCV